MTRHEVPRGLADVPLNRYLKRAWPMLSGFVLRDILKKRDVRRSGVRLSAEDTVRGGDVLEIYAPDKYLRPAVEVLFDDGRLMAALKPQGLPSLPDADGVGADTMQARLERIHAGVRLCHRLDAGTGGVMLAAVDDAVYEQAFAAFRDHSIDKRYAALLCARPPKDKMELRAWLVKDARRASVRVLNAPAPGAKPIVTQVRMLGAASDFWRVQLSPVTGRTHQLRAHMAHIGCPILGDDKYGDREINRRAGMAQRLCLWCEEIGVPEGSPLKDYAGRAFRADAPDWIKK